MIGFLPRGTVYPQSLRLRGLEPYLLLAILQVLPAANQPTTRRPAQSARDRCTVTLKRGRSLVDSPHKWPIEESFGGFIDISLNKLLIISKSRRCSTPAIMLYDVIFNIALYGADFIGIQLHFHIYAAIYRYNTCRFTKSYETLTRYL